ncbi:hypothetical protein G3A_06275 [Bacillus sp. 17376]|uniref:Uncharacterized protein n=1 Tax=Mesobacillus boroniphilus JCM 21738 TaxID=1294265 RepID=W4RSD8_9BACI|nr:hypothetical protein G3A_06275 [Bacillus sp. 17376]GAE47340.1 hypothetical protein JCM21738_4312 [Mesobacillus boroniphilus JCM 21738]
MKKVILVMLFWGMIIFSVIAQVSDKFINWLSPNALSLIDERMTYTFVPMMMNFFVLFLMRKIRMHKSWFLLFFIANVFLFLFYISYQYGDWGLGRVR